MTDLLLVVGGLVLYPVVLAVSCYLITLLHELGHALVALAATNGPVVVHVGSYGQEPTHWQGQLGRLRFYLYLRPQLRRWCGGCCQHEPVASPWLNILILLAGPTLPLLASGLAFSCSFYYPNGWWRLPLFLLAFLASVSLLANLLRGGRVKLADGREVRHDGGQIWQLLRYPARHRLHWQVLGLVQAGCYADAARGYEQLLHHHGPADTRYRELLDCYWRAGKVEVALSVSQQFERTLPARFTDDDWFQRGSLLSHLNRHQSALAFYEQLLARPVPYASAYNNRGYTRSLLGQQETAVADFNQAIAHGVEPAYAYANRGLARLRQGRAAEALADIAHSLALNPAEAYAYRNRGLCYLGQGEHAAALADFKQAQQLNPCTHGIEEYLRQASCFTMPA